jgi:hypothetical protein
VSNNVGDLGELLLEAGRKLIKLGDDILEAGRVAPKGFGDPLRRHSLVDEPDSSHGRDAVTSRYPRVMGRVEAALRRPSSGPSLAR